MPGRHSVTEVARSFADFVNRVAYRRESFVLVRGNKPVAELRPLPLGGRLTDLADLVEALPRLACADADAYATDLDRARAELTHTGVANPWQS